MVVRRAVGGVPVVLAALVILLVAGTAQGSRRPNGHESEAVQVLNDAVEVRQRLAADGCAALEGCETCTMAAMDGCAWCGAGFCTNSTGGMGEMCPSGCLYTTCPNCTEYTNCDTCSADPSCGWCTTNETCVLGTAANACNATAQCPAEDWNFLNCSNNCVSYDGDCASCASHFERDGCVYCEGDDLCLFKDNSELCQCPYSECGPTDCSNHTTCDECTGDLLCGWCNTTGKCVAGRGSGPCANGSCPGFPAAWNYASCDNYCSSYDSDCAECVAHHEVGGCVYCADSALCLEGNTLFDASSCNCPEKTCGTDNCAAHTECDACTADAECGWCLATGKCHRGVDDTPCNSTLCDDPAKNWLYSSCTVDCYLFNDSCAECVSELASSGCQWCATSNECLPPSAQPSCSCLDSACVNCTAFKDCESCSEQDECGFCSATQTCVAGRAAGPCFDSPCTKDPALWNYDDCSANCPWYNASCAACVSHFESSTCEWCVGTESCVSQANGANCTCLEHNCDKNTCDVYTDCQTCTLGGCGWCPDGDGGGSGGKCMAGAADGPCSGNCSKGWSFGNCDGTCMLASNSCDACTNNSFCGYCAGTPGTTTGASINLCLAGSQLGPSDGRHCDAWHDGSKQSCPNCQDFSDCWGCVSDASCGWCGNRCAEGNADGPFAPDDPTPCELWSFNDCETWCNDYVTCENCTAAPSCGWCRKPSNLHGYCIGEAFKSVCYQWNEASCDNSCESNLVCESCVLNATCGWCTPPSGAAAEAAAIAAEQEAIGGGPISPATATGEPLTAMCLPGNGMGPSNHDTCDWSYGPASCSPVNECALVTDCASCCENSNCGWCDLNGGGCEEGTSTGPTQGSCADKWEFYPGQCSAPITTCESLAGCENCLAAEECGWCPTLSICKKGGKGGPTPPFQCPDWEFLTCNPYVPPTSSPTAAPGGMSKVAVVLITAGAILLPVAIVAVVLYRKFVKKYGYTPLA